MLKITIYKKCDNVHGMIYTIYTELDNEFIKNTIDSIPDAKIIFIKIISADSIKSDLIADIILPKFRNKGNIKIIMFIENDEFKSKFVDNFRRKNITIKIKKIKVSKNNELRPLLLNYEK